MVQVLVKVRVADFPHFIGIFSTRAASLRKKHGCRRARLFQVCGSENDVMILLDWENRPGFEGFLSDPVVKEAMKTSGTVSPPEITFLELAAEFPG